MKLDEASVPARSRERGPWLVAGGAMLAAACVLAAVLSGAIGGRPASSLPPLPPPAATPARGAGAAVLARAGRRVYVSNELPSGSAVDAGHGGGPTSERPETAGGGSARHARGVSDADGGTAPGALAGENGVVGASATTGGSAAAHAGATTGGNAAAHAGATTGGSAAADADALAADSALATPIGKRWLEGFYRIYEVAEKAFGVNWLLIASIHRQESAFSTAPSTYHGLNFAGCCGGPMQFNVKDGPVSTWDRVANSYRDGPRPGYYDHRTARHPSIYDDFDAVMAASHLLALDGAGYALNDSAWIAAYDYYGHDVNGVRYADEVIARAIGWSQHRFCPSCGLDAGVLEAVSAAYGAPVLAVYEAKARRDGGRSGRRSNDHLGGDGVGRARSSAKQPAR